MTELKKKLDEILKPKMDKVDGFILDWLNARNISVAELPMFGCCKEHEINRLYALERAGLCSSKMEKSGADSYYRVFSAKK